MNELWPWVTLVLLGAYHGLNPGMGWLFAVAVGLQERRRVAVLRAFVPIALGHAASIAAVVMVVALAQTVVSTDILSKVGALALVGFGLYKLLAPMSHPRWVGMRVNFRDLVAWSFLMATAHGAGLMLTPVLLRVSDGAVAHVVEAASSAHAVHSHHQHADHLTHAAHLASTAVDVTPLAEVSAIGLHTLSMFVVMAIIAIVVYEKVGLAILRRAWFNLDQLWAVALILAGVLTLVMA